ncbi:alcohol dehydrogenase [Cytobacillus horneckiae]|uniref:Alcohol dehydrogenase n=1 Tax=Cytobacillus horneckiae TaxID=549687 RepID=A0A2N0ZMQ5_9BACI|nr:zinc-dependent alcohol dehydrogenase family protein [Cytobacillus horneckiae]MBN6886329.1 zinc-dependent alcohol dehydrogenase family protein [Cytobacillus horneckiae]MEC1159100.1 zinc-dependent alcohol dehydrogenase family protein [Cytobacillus horneckiae]MED2938792.1 zinc-dependent alcohol dehydrogenase family protein [Cytobacillus horneckiae]PKG30792.1 alcohol dehydrogenase [Cytobacillus horneckiae]
MIVNSASVKYDQFGDPSEVLRIEYEHKSAPKDYEVLVRMKLRPINPSDLIPVRGSYAHRITLPAIPGYEGVGIVEQVGNRVSADLIGKRVLPLRGEGTWQEVVKTSAAFTVPIPDSINDTAASQMYINPITAWVTLTEVLKIKAGDTLVVNACGSAIGHIYAQLTKLIGCRLIAVVRNGDYTERLLQLGAFHVIDTSKHSLTEAIMALTYGRGADAAIDSIGGDEGNLLSQCVQPTGTFLTIGLLSGVQVDWREISSRVNAKLFHLRHWNRNTSIRTWHKTFERIIDLAANEKLLLMNMVANYDLHDIKMALHAVEEKKEKVFLTS